MAAPRRGLHPARARACRHDAGITIITQATPEVKREVWKVRTNGSRLMLRSGTGTKYKIIGKYYNGTEVVLLEKTTSSWYRMLAPDGKQGLYVHRLASVCAHRGHAWSGRGGQ